MNNNELLFEMITKQQETIKLLNMKVDILEKKIEVVYKAIEKYGKK